MDEGLEYSEQAELSRYLFYADLNEINIFVEDKNKEFEYESIFERLFAGEYKIASIIAANGKPGVKDAFFEFGERDENNLSHKNFYIVDGDFDRYIYSEQMINNEHFIYLDYYNIENYFIDEKAVLKFAKGKLHRLDKDVSDIILFSNWKEKIVNQAKRLFLLYCAVQKVMPSQENVARNEYLFINHKTGFEREGGYEDYYRLIASKQPDIDIHIEMIREVYENINGDDYFGLICGKFLLTSLFVYLEGKTHTKFSKDELKWWLINEFEVSNLNYIKEKVDTACMC